MGVVPTDNPKFKICTFQYVLPGHCGVKKLMSIHQR